MELVKAQAWLEPWPRLKWFTLPRWLAAKLAGEPEVEVVEERSVPDHGAEGCYQESSITCLICGHEDEGSDLQAPCQAWHHSDQYRAQFGYKKTQPLACKSLSRARKGRWRPCSCGHARVLRRLKRSPLAKPKTNLPKRLPAKRRLYEWSFNLMVRTAHSCWGWIFPSDKDGWSRLKLSSR